MPRSRSVPAAALRRRIAVLEAELAAACTDPLTGLPTRAHWTRLAESTYPAAASVLLVDLDGFKAVNDTHGHAAGDLILTHTGHRLAVNLPAGSIVGRLGGDEFIALTTRPLTDPREFDRLVDAVTAPVTTPAGPVLRVGISIGLAAPDQLHGQGLPAVMGAADLAMYQAKRTGRGWATYQPHIHGTPTIITRPLPRTRHHDAA